MSHGGRAAISSRSAAQARLARPLSPRQGRDPRGKRRPLRGTAWRDPQPLGSDGFPNCEGRNKVLQGSGMKNTFATCTWWFPTGARWFPDIRVVNTESDFRCKETRIVQQTARGETSMCQKRNALNEEKPKGPKRSSLPFDGRARPAHRKALRSKGAKRQASGVLRREQPEVGHAGTWMP